MQHFEVFFRHLKNPWSHLTLISIFIFLLKHRYTINKKHINISCFSLLKAFSILRTCAASGQWMEKLKCFQIASITMPWTHIKFSTNQFYPRVYLMVVAVFLNRHLWGYRGLGTRRPPQQINRAFLHQERLMSQPYLHIPAPLHLSSSSCHFSEFDSSGVF